MESENRGTGAFDPALISYLPAELVQFVLRDTYSLLIKGLAGTGKTTLSLTILRAIKGQSRFFYISTRTSPKQLFQYYPWLEGFAEVEANGGGEKDQEPVGMASFEDARLDEPESLFERITNQLMDIKSPVIVIDSWDAVASFMDKEARLNNERVLQTWRERAGAKLIFISEHPDDTTLDFLVDGVVELKLHHFAETRLREITLHKMRGVRITRPSYFYSLENAVFRSLRPYSPPLLENFKGKELLSDGKNTQPESAHHIGTGYEILDSSLGGGFPRNGLVLLEIDKHVGTIIPVIFLGRAVRRFLGAGNPVLLQLFDSIGPDIISQSISPFLSKNMKKNLLTILPPSYATKPSQRGGNPVLANANKTSGALLTTLAGLNRTHRGKPLLQILGTEFLKESLNGEASNVSLARLFESEDKQKRNLLIMVGRSSSQDTLKRVMEICDMHLKLMMINGTLLLQSLLPASTPFGIVADQEKPYNLKLEPMV